MDPESIVYGYIRDWPSDDGERSRVQRDSNHQVIRALPAGRIWPFLGREMFSFCNLGGLYQTQVIHFGASYPCIEYEWRLWIEQFERLLRHLYWTSAVVHLETESTGVHTFRWESDNGFYSPRDGEWRMRCVWEREGGV